MVLSIDPSLLLGYYQAKAWVAGGAAASGSGGGAPKVAPTPLWSTQETPKQALDAVAKKLPDVILMDLSIPGVDGWEVTRRLKADARTQAVPIIALTAHAMRGDEERARAAGCDHYLAKPISPKKVVEEVRKILKL